MRKIGDITSTATAAGEFTNGSVATGVSPTILDAAWFNSVQRELIAVLTAASLTPDSSNDDQLLASMKALFIQPANALSEITSLGSAKVASLLSNIGFTGVLSGNGYIKIPLSVSGVFNTLIIQWGSFTGTTSSSAGADSVYENSNIPVTWPTTFPNNVLQVITGGSSDVGGAGVQEMAWNLSKSKTGAIFGVQCRVASATMTGSYISIGY